MSIVRLTSGDFYDTATMRPVSKDRIVQMDGGEWVDSETGQITARKFDDRRDGERISAFRAIRMKCGACQGGDPDRLPLGEVAASVNDCPSSCCPLWPFRFGRDPWRAPPSDAQKEAGRALAERTRAARTRNPDENDG